MRTMTWRAGMALMAFVVLAPAQAGDEQLTDADNVTTAPVEIVGEPMEIVGDPVAVVDPSTADASPEPLSEVEYYRQLGVTFDEDGEMVPLAATPAVPVPEAVPYYVTEYPARRYECYEFPANAFTVTPHYYNARNSKARHRVGSTSLTTGRGHANGVGGEVAYTRRVTEFFSLGVAYRYAFLRVSGATAIDTDAYAAGVRGREHSRWHSHQVGLLPEFGSRELGRLQFTFSQSFDRVSGSETWTGGPGGDSRRNTGRGNDITALGVWYQKEIDLAPGWQLAPYAGWRSEYVAVRGRNDFTVGLQDRETDNYWQHFVSGGLALEYGCGPLGVTLRGGVNHRTSANQAPVYGYRAVAPGVTQFSHRANLDRTVGTAGAALTLRAGQHLTISAGYDGYYGSDTTAHMGSLLFSLPF